MIRYSLHCDRAHEFEGWFSSSEDFDRQVEAGFVTCPHCNSSAVSKLLMAPQVNTSRQKERSQALAMDAQRREMIRRLKEVVEDIRRNSEDVGDRFPEEARKIHYGETEARGIIGQASHDEVISLIEEGIQIAPLPTLPDDAN